MVRPKSVVPRGYQSVMPYLRVSDAANAIRFYKKAFGAKENYRLKMPGAKIGHAELNIGGSILMLADAAPGKDRPAPKAAKGMAGMHLTIYTDNVDKLVAKAVKAGARLTMPVADQFYGERVGQIADPFGHVWSIHARFEKVAPQDMQKRLNAMLSGKAPSPKAPAKAAARPRKPTKTVKAATAAKARPAKKAAKTPAKARKARKA